MFNPGAHLRVLNFPPTARGRKAEARHKIVPKLTDGHFKETLRKLDSLERERERERERKKRASNIALSNKMPSHLAKEVSSYIAIARGKRRNTRRKRGSSRGRSRRVKTRGKRTRNSSGSRSRRGSKRGTRRGSRRGKR